MSKFLIVCGRVAVFIDRQNKFPERMRSVIFGGRSVQRRFVKLLLAKFRYTRFGDNPCSLRVPLNEFFPKYSLWMFFVFVMISGFVILFTPASTVCKQADGFDRSIPVNALLLRRSVFKPVLAGLHTEKLGCVRFTKPVKLLSCRSSSRSDVG